MAARQLALTPSLVAQVHRVLEDAGPDPNVVYHTEEDYDAVVHHLLSAHALGQDLWLFAYGSLLWKPEVDHVEERMGMAHGWHRAFRLRITRWRATEDQPGLMMALDRDGQCRGVLYRIPAATGEQNLGKLVRREMSAKPPTNVPRWIRVETDAGSVQAIAFVINRRGRVYAGKVSLEDTARLLAKACGHWGSCAEYLHKTVVHLEERGIHDRNLWRLQSLVAEQIKAATSSPGSGTTSRVPCTRLV
jgi:glutathione-specific gamma-glutamylcyclotransferase